jgi:replicative DNA helicase
MIIDFNAHVQKIKDVRSGKIKEGLKLGIPEIDEHFRYKAGNFNVILGHANTGKTTVILYIMLLYSIKHNLKWLVFSSENEPYTLIKKLVEFMEGNVINKIEEEYFQSRIEFIILL